MPRYYFHLGNDASFFFDDCEGVDLPDDNAIRDYAAQVARELSKNNDSPDQLLIVTNEQGKIVCQLRLRDEVGIIRPPRK